MTVTLGLDFGNGEKTHMVLTSSNGYSYWGYGNATIKPGDPVMTHSISESNEQDLTMQYHIEQEFNSAPTSCVIESVTYSCDYVSMGEPHELDVKYPHYCHKCDKKLKWRELLNANKNKDEKHLEKLWKSEIIEFYCCSCFRKE